MEIEQLKSGWQNAGKAAKSEADLLLMTKPGHHPTLKKIRIKLITETILLLIFSIVYYDWFDGAKKPFYANILLQTSLLFYIGMDVITYAALVKPVCGLNLQLSIKNYLRRIKRLSVYALIFSFFYSISLIVFFASVINFTREKSFLLLGLIVILCQLIFWSYRIWTKRIKNLSEQVEALEADED